MRTAVSWKKSSKASVREGTGYPEKEVKKMEELMKGKLVIVPIEHDVGPASRYVGCAKMVKDPSNSEWSRYSVEFCGGTHVTNMCEVEAFAILEETSVAKGIRRIVGGTGDVAKQALALTQQLGERLDKLEAEKSPGEADITSLGMDLEKSLISAASKPLFMDRLGKLRKKLKKAQKSKGASKAEVKAAKEAVNAAVKAVEGPCAVVCLEGIDAKSLGGLAGGHRDVAVLLLSEAGGKVNCVAVVPDSNFDSLKADAWVQAALEPLGGRGGGKPGRAQGSAPASEGCVAKAEAAALNFSKAA